MTVTSSWRRRWQALITALALAAGGVAAFGAAPATGQQQVEKPAPVMVSLDASGSMADDAGNGKSKMAAAKETLSTLVGNLDSNAQLGLQVYGSETEESAPKRVACEDVVTKVPVSQLDASKVKSAVSSLRPSGHTPIGKALQEAAKELPDSGPRSVVLISDGIDTCAPPKPCDVAKDLEADGVDLSVHTVGFQIDKEAREQLSCIADSTGGSYTDVPDATTLDQQLPDVVERAQRTYEAEGTPITGTEDFLDAPGIKPGQYVDEIDSGQTKYYKVRIPKGFSVHFAASAILPRDEGGGYGKLYTRIVDAQGEKCTGNTERFKLRGNDWQAHATSAFGWDSTEDNSSCESSDVYYLAVERDGPREASHWTWQTELLLTLEPPVSGSTGPEANESEVPFQDPGGPKRQVTGGSSFNDATELPGDGIYEDTLHNREMVTYKVRLDWGESLALRAHTREPTDDQYTEVNTRVFDPSRKQEPGSDWDNRMTLKGETDTSKPIETYRVLYNNRDDDGSDPGLAGWYYITVTASTSDEDERVNMPLRLFVSKGGTKIDPPEYTKTNGFPAGPVTGNAGNMGSAESGSDAQTASVEEAATENALMPVWLWIVLGTAVGGGAALLITLLVRNRSRTRPSPPPQGW